VNHDERKWEENDDMAWLAILAGREHPDADSRTQREARTLRRVLLDRVSATAPEPSWEAFKQRLDREGWPAAKRPRWFARIPQALAAGIALIVVSGTALYYAASFRNLPDLYGNFDDYPLARGVVAIPERVVADPRREVESLKRQLKTLNLPYRVQEIAQGLQVEFYVGSEPALPVKAFLDTQKIVVGDDYWVRLVYRWN
jgi:hypothetical protein